ncbi:MAG TPA: hypothetical protein VF234_05750 [Limnochordia bacterium]
MGPWVSVLVVVAVASVCSLVTYLLTRLRMERESAERVKELAEAVAALENEKAKFEEAARGIEENARRQALDEFLADLRIEERRYVREHRVLFMTRKALVLEERIFFRNIPISNWVAHEIPVEEGADLDAMAKTMRVFAEIEQGAATGRDLRKLLKAG